MCPALCLLALPIYYLTESPYNNCFTNEILDQNAKELVRPEMELSAISLYFTKSVLLKV